ncbi:hypothetical protein MKEN_00545400 [Mycena kentingensis (nom. inval.)]|nr:hypothetical protein MKEN_00545400 [Mycena kentingensis (nom. inval.)]
MLLVGRRNVGVHVLRVGVRHKHVNKPRVKPKEEKEKRGIERDAMGRVILPKREKSLGTYKALAVSNLKHELFETEEPGRVELDVGMLHPRMLTPGGVTRFHNGPTSPLRVYGVPKHLLLEFRILGAQCAVTTSSTLSLVRVLEESRDLPARIVLNGRAGCGKSFLLLQAVQYAHASQDWIVIYVPRTKRFVDSPAPPRETLSRIGRANAHLLPQLKTASVVKLEGDRTWPVGTPLQTLIDAAAAEELLAPALLEAVMAELGAQEEYPVLLAIDDFQTLTGATAYRNPQFRMIRPHHLSMPRLLLEYASGRKKLARGLVLGALCRSDTQFPVSNQLSDALGLPDEFGPTPRGTSIRRSTQLAAYLEHEVPLYLPDDMLGAAEFDEEAETANLAAAEGARIPWTGWNVYDPPIYEENIVPNRHDPFEKPKSAELWREMIIEQDEKEKEVVQTKFKENLPTAEELAEEAAEEAEEKRKEERAQKEASRLGTQELRVKALRAVRIPSGFSVREAASLFELWLDAGVIRTGGERRLERRAGLQAIEDNRELNAEVAADPELAADPDAKDYKPADADSAAEFAEVFQELQSKMSGQGKTPEEQIEATVNATMAHEILEAQKQLDGAEMADIRGFERQEAMEKWFKEEGKYLQGIRSWDEEMALSAMREAEDVEENEEKNEEEQKEPSAAATQSSANAQNLSALDEFAAEFSDTPPASSSDAAAAAENDGPLSDDELAFGDDPEVARLVSDGMRGAFNLTDGQLEHLMRSPVETDPYALVQSMPETGADALFLSKFAESSGNPRAFVWGGLLATLQSSGMPAAVGEDSEET